MLTDALAMFDALGFKGIWKREGINPNSVIDKLGHLEHTVQESGVKNLAEIPLLDSPRRWDPRSGERGVATVHSTS